MSSPGQFPMLPPGFLPRGFTPAPVFIPSPMYIKNPFFTPTQGTTLRPTYSSRNEPPDQTNRVSSNRTGQKKLENMTKIGFSSK